MVFSLLFTPLGRYAIFGMLALVLTTCVYFKIRSDAIAEVEAAAAADVLRRTQNAVNAGDSVDTSPDGLLKSDGHRRD
jgi:high-affinity K+ transport system ATPase subunit B